MTSKTVTITEIAERLGLTYEGARMFAKQRLCVAGVLDRRQRRGPKPRVYRWEDVTKARQDRLLPPRMRHAPTPETLRMLDEVLGVVS